jgi:uncharacterized delta-60 repeat protein
MLGATLIAILAVTGTTTTLAAGDGLDPTFGEDGIVTTDFVNSLDHIAALSYDAGIPPWYCGYEGYWVAGSTDRGSGSDFIVANYSDVWASNSLYFVQTVVADAGGSETGTSLAFYTDSMHFFYVIESGYSDGGAGTDFAVWAVSCQEVMGLVGGAPLTTDLGGADRAYAVAMQSDKAVLAGASDISGTNDFALVRYMLDSLPDLSVDGGFGGSGIVLTDLGEGSDDEALALAVQPDGKLVAAGVSDGDFALVRYTADGDLDTSFGDDGIVTTNFGSGSTDRGQAVVLQPDGKIVVAGSSNGDFALARYNADGTLDATFGSGGLVTTDFGGEDEAVSIQIQPDGKLVVAGDSGEQHAFARYNVDGSLDVGFGASGKQIVGPSASTAYSTAGALILSDGKIIAAGNVSAGGLEDIDFLRLNADGTLDSAFGSDGLIVTSFGSMDEARDMLVQPDGKIVVGGYIRLDDVYGLGVARYNADGALDTSFGQGGLVRPAAAVLLVSGLAQQADGKIVAAGNVQETIIVRLNTDGSLDTSFGTDGIVTEDICGGTDYIEDVAIQPDQKIIVVGSCVYTAIVVARFNTDGGLDISFGTNGVMMTEIADSREAYAVALQPDGKIVVAGQGGTGINVLRLNPDGTLDATFDGDGVTVVPEPNGYNLAEALALQPDGKIVVGGYSSDTNGQNFDLELIRLNADGSPDTTFDGDGVLVTDLGTDLEEIMSLALQPDGKILASGYRSPAPNTAQGVIVRYNTDGSLDTGFGDNGVFGIGDTPNIIVALALYPDSKLVAAGTTNLVFNEDFMVARLNLDIEPVGAPSDLIATANGQEQIDLAWTDNSSDETAFHVERSPAGQDDWQTIATLGADTEGYSDTTVLCGTGYDYRVRAYRSYDDQFSDYSNVASATTDACALTAPVLRKPTDGSSTNKLKFQWYKVEGAVEYQVQVDNDADFSSPEIDATSSKTKYKPDVMPPFGDYYWRVRARDAAGNWSEWSDVWGFQFTILKKPGEDYSTTSTVLKFSWRKVKGALEYQIQVDNDADFTSPEIDDTSLKNKYEPVDPFAPGTYNWRVRVRTAGGWEGWAPGWAFTVTP